LPNAIVEPVDENSGAGYFQRFRSVADTNGEYTTPLATPPGNRFAVAVAAVGDNNARIVDNVCLSHMGVVDFSAHT